MRMLPTVITNLFFRPVTRDYPSIARKPFPRTRGELVNDVSQCIFCGLCARKCPSKCLKVEKGKAEGVWTLEFLACVGCGVCVDVCPVHCLSQLSTHRPVELERAVITLHGKFPVQPVGEGEG
jgi:ech hydrogenase subunit F